MNLKSKDGWAMHYWGRKRIACMWPSGDPAQHTGLIEMIPQGAGSECSRGISILPAWVPPSLPLLRSSCAHSHQTRRAILAGIWGSWFPSLHRARKWWLVARTGRKLRTLSKGEVKLTSCGIKQINLSSFLLSEAQYSHLKNRDYSYLMEPWKGWT